MNTLVSKLLNIINRLRGRLPSPTPMGLKDFHQWADSIIEVYRLPGTPESLKFALATMLMRLDPSQAYVPKRYFALCLHKGMAGQVANQVMYDIKTAQQERIAAEAAKAAEATAPAVVDNVTKE